MSSNLESLRTTRLNKIKNTCYSNLLSGYSFIPEDFHKINDTSNNPLEVNSLFENLSMLYSIIHLFDIVNIEHNSIEYKLNGYKSLNGKLDISAMNKDSCQLYFEIYTWVYEGGNLIDKIGIARNIISLNLNADTLEIQPSTFTAIQSGFQIYQKENIRQYIDIRNKMTDQLLELQEKADKIVDGYIDDYKKSTLTIISLFISVIVLQAISDGNFFDAFGLNITLLSFSFLIISLIVMFFTKTEINKQIMRYEETYNNMKERYLDLLDNSDINRILNDDKDFNDNKKYIEGKKCQYTFIWILTLAILFISILTLYVINNKDILFNDKLN